MMSLGGTVSSTRLAPAVNILPGMNAGASTYAVPSPIKGSGTAWVLLGSWALSPARPTPIHPRHECRGLSALFGECQFRRTGDLATWREIDTPGTNVAYRYSPYAMLFWGLPHVYREALVHHEGLRQMFPFLARLPSPQD